MVERNWQFVRDFIIENTIEFGRKEMDVRHFQANERGISAA